MTLDQLMFAREHFPLVLQQTTGYKGKRFWDFNRIEIPPYHPSMKEGGINFKSVPELLYEVVEQNDLGITIDSVPVVGHFYVGKNGMNPYGYHGDQGISINPEIAAPSF